MLRSPNEDRSAVIARLQHGFAQFFPLFAQLAEIIAQVHVIIALYGG
ncbi:hypothetical protein [Bacillus gobiensis]